MAEAVVTKKGSGSVGLYNQGATCYLNSLLQLLFHTTYFRNAVYRMATEADDINSITKALQLMFYQMQMRDAAFSTKSLTDAFGWSGADLFVQHDTHELVTLLRDSIEEKMKGTPSEGALNRLFAGTSERFFSCLDGSYTSRNRSVFYDIQVQVQGFDDLVSSLKSTLTVEQLTGSNKYRVEEEGKEPVYKDAETGTRYLKFPPVIVCHLKRIDIDLESPTLEQKKINTPFSYPDVLDLAQIEHGLGDDEQKDEGAEIAPIYDLYGIIVHRGSVRSGHYFCYMRDLNTDTQQWGDWCEFDDECVREVDQHTAVDVNYGGYIYRTASNGYRMQVLSPQNAYILAYVRRGEAANVFCQSHTDSIPADVKSEFDRVAAEEEERRREAERVARLCTVTILTDNDIEEHVARNKFDLGHGRLPAASLNITLDKGDSWNAALTKIGDLLQLPPSNFRVWMCENRTVQSYGSGWRIANQTPDAHAYLPLFQPQRDTTVSDEIGARFTKEPPAGQWQVVLYVQVAVETPQHVLTNAAHYVRAAEVSSTNREEEPAQLLADSGVIRFSHDDQRPTLRMHLDKRYPVRRVAFRVHHFRNVGSCAMKIRVNLYSGRQMVHNEERRVAFAATEFVTYVSVDCNRADIDVIEIQRNAAMADTDVPPFMISRVAVTVPPAELGSFVKQPTLALNRPTSHTMVMLKFFNHRTDTFAHIGACMIPVGEDLRHSLPIFCHRVGLPAGGKYALFEERTPVDISELALDAAPSDPVRAARNVLRNGSIVILQEDPEGIPLCYQHPRADGFLKTFSDVRMINVRNIAKPDEIVSVVPMQGRWKFPRIVDALGKTLEVDATFLRFYMSSSHRHPTPRDEPERSQTRMTLSDMSLVQDWPTNDMWVEVLSVPRAEIERIVAVKATVASERGAVESPDHRDITFNLNSDATAKDVIAGVLERASVPFDGHYALLVIFDKVIRHVFPTHPDQPCDKRIHKFFVRHSDRTFEVRKYTPPGEDEIEYPVSIGQYGNHPVMHGTPFLLSFGKEANPQDVLDRLLDLTELGEQDLGEYKIMMFTTAALYFKDFETTLVEYWRLTPTNVLPSLMLEAKKPKEKPGSRYISYNDPTLSIDKRKKKT